MPREPPAQRSKPPAQRRRVCDPTGERIEMPGGGHRRGKKHHNDTTRLMTPKGSADFVVLGPGSSPIVQWKFIGASHVKEIMSFLQLPFHYHPLPFACASILKSCGYGTLGSPTEAARGTGSKPDSTGYKAHSSPAQGSLGLATA